MPTEAQLLDARPRLAPRVRLQADPVTQAAVLLYPEGILELNDTAREIVSRCDGAATLGSLIAALEEEFEAGAGEMRDDVVACVRELQRRQLLVLA
jgi:pyrroloquinoline quinone biosynthesis protein D